MRCFATRFVAALMITLAGCHNIPKTTMRPYRVWHVPALAVSVPAVLLSRRSPSAHGALIVIDSASLRSTVNPAALSASQPATGNPPPLLADADRVATLTTFQMGRYHPETLRAISEDSSVTETTTRAALRQAGAIDALLLDFQETPPDELRSFTRALSWIALVARGARQTPIAMIVPPQDTLSYPTAILARSADILIVRGYGAHRPGTSPGPATTPDFVMRAIGLRARTLGPNRVGVELPLFGYRWEKDGTARPVSYAEVSSNVIAEASAFRRDPASQYLVANGRDGWSAWVPDGRTIEFLLSAAKRSGLAVYALSGMDGAAPDIDARVASALRR